MGGQYMHIYIPQDHVHKKVIRMNMLIGVATLAWVRNQGKGLQGCGPREEAEE